jgi:ATP-dependent exoDNAse (exonuclease V) alpha subunit
MPPLQVEEVGMTNAWSPQQIEALARIDKWLHDPNGRQVFYLAGFAGTGKTTLSAEIARRVNEDNGAYNIGWRENDEGEWREVEARAVLFGAFTNKAAAVMRAKGCTDADTIDHLIYKPLIETYCVRKPSCDDPKGCRCRAYSRERHVGRELNPESAVKDAALVIIDEVSMVGREMAEDLLSFGTKVLVIGDPAQLPPIEDFGYSPPASRTTP